MLGHLVAAAARRWCGGGVGWPVFSLRPIHAMSPQGSPNLVLPSIVQVGGICSTYVCMRAVCTYRSADGGQLLHTMYIHSFSPTLHANSRFLSGLGLLVSMGTWRGQEFIRQDGRKELLYCKLIKRLLESSKSVGIHRQKRLYFLNNLCI